MDTRHAKTLLALLLFSIVASSCGPSRDPYFDRGFLGRVYNSADGSCVVSGQSFDFWFDGHLLGNIGPGRSVEARLEAGPHRAEVIDHRGITVATHTFSVSGDNWYYYFGCADGTHP